MHVDLLENIRVKQSSDWINNQYTAHAPGWKHISAHYFYCLPALKHSDIFAISRETNRNNDARIYNTGLITQSSIHGINE